MSTEQLLKNAWEVVNSLNALACKGDGEAAVALMKVGARCASETQSLLPCSLDLQAKLKASAYWPVVLPVKKTKRDQLISELLNLDFAKDCELNEAGKVQDSDPLPHAVQLVWSLVVHLRTMKKSPPTPLMFRGRATSAEQLRKWKAWAQTNAKNIPQRLTRAHARKYADLTEPLLSIFWGEQFEHHADFGSCYNRADIVNRWRQAWHSMARPEPKKAKPAK
jgi:hypothetical protein